MIVLPYVSTKILKDIVNTQLEKSWFLEKPFRSAFICGGSTFSAMKLYIKPVKLSFLNNAICWYVGKVLIINQVRVCVFFILTLLCNLKMTHCEQNWGPRFKNR